MADSINVTLAGMVDLALCSPEIGAVNFNILRSLLLMMLRHLKMSDITVELTGQEIPGAQDVRDARDVQDIRDAQDVKDVRRGEKGARKPGAKKPAHKKSPDTGKKELDKKVKGEGAKADTRKHRAAKEDADQKTSEGMDDLSKETSSLEGTYERDTVTSTIERTITDETFGSAEYDDMIYSLRDDLNSVRKDVDQIIEEIRNISELTEKVPFEALYNSVKEIDDLKSKLEELTIKLSDKSGDKGDDESGSEGEDSVTAQLHELRDKLNSLYDQVQGLDSNLTSQIEGLLEQIGALECDLGRVMEQINTEQPEGDAMAQDFTGLGELQSRLQQLQSDMEHVNQVTTKLMDDEEERQTQYDALVEQVEVLKMVKADREVVEDALAEKADQVVVNRKVSHEQFDTACDDLARGLDEAFTKLCQQETIWKNALDDVQNEIGLKLDKVELTPLRDFIQQRLKDLQEKLKALAARKELEAAGTKKLLRDVNCISCDKDVVMKRQLDTPSVPIQPSLPPTRSIRPYVTYELDKLRHQQKRPMGKNLLQLEDMEQEYEKKTRKEKSPPEEVPEHLVNRYCGGSHTVIAPHQRVMRAGYQTTQTSPEALGFTEIALRGTDGQLYHGQEMPQNIKKPDVTEATQTSELLLKTPSKDAVAKGDSKAVKATAPDTPKSPPAPSRGSKVAFAEPQQGNESPAAQGS